MSFKRHLLQNLTAEELADKMHGYADLSPADLRELRTDIPSEQQQDLLSVFRRRQESDTRYVMLVEKWAAAIGAD